MDYIYAMDTSHDSLAHYGIRGQKWGVRRYQNLDGSLTEEGRLRYTEISHAVMLGKDYLNGCDLDTIQILHISDSELYHFEFPKFPSIPFPKIDIPKIEPPKINLPKIDIGGVAKSITEGVTNTITGGNDKERQWKEHKWVARKRDKNGKWIYDYGDGFPGEKSKKLQSSKDITYNPNKQIPNTEIHPVQKVSDFIGALATTLVNPELMSTIGGTSKIVGAMSEAAQQAVTNIRRASSKTDEKTGFKLKNNKNASKEEDMWSVNPGYDNVDYGSQTNCPCCSVAYDMRRRGYEVMAKENAGGLSEQQIVSLYKNPKVKRVEADEPNYDLQGKNKALSKAANKQLSTEPEGSRGVCWMYWKGGGGHIVNYEIENGKAYIYDGQPRKRATVDEYVDRAATFEYFRTDNLEPDLEQVRKVIR